MSKMIMIHVDCLPLQHMVNSLNESVSMCCPCSLESIAIDTHEAFLEFIWRSRKLDFEFQEGPRFWTTARRSVIARDFLFMCPSIFAWKITISFFLRTAAFFVVFENSLS